MAVLSVRVAATENEMNIPAAVDRHDSENLYTGERQPRYIQVAATRYIDRIIPAAYTAHAGRQGRGATLILSAIGVTEPNKVRSFVSRFPQIHATGHSIDRGDVDIA